MSDPKGSDFARMLLRNNIDRLRNERDSIFRKMEESTNTSERKSLNWAWHIKQSQLRLCVDKSTNPTIID